MPEHDQVQELLNTFGQAALAAAGPPPFPAASYAVAPAIADPGRVISEVFGLTLDPKEGRKVLIDKLQHLFRPEKNPQTGKTSWVQQRGDVTADIMQNGWPLVGPAALPAVLLEALSNYADGALGQIKPLESVDGDGCGHEPVAALIRSTIAALRAQFASGRPLLVPEIDALVNSLVGDAAEDGYIGDLRERCGIDVSRACTVEDEQIVTRFEGLKALAANFATTWREVASAGDEHYFLIAAQDIQRYLFAIVSTVSRLRLRIPEAELALAEVPSMRGLNIARFLEFTQFYCGRRAVEELRKGRDGIRSLREHMLQIDKVLEALLGCCAAEENPDPDDPCAGVPMAFTHEKVQRLLQELRCQAARVLEITDRIRCTPEPPCRTTEKEEGHAQ